MREREENERGRERMRGRPSVRDKTSERMIRRDSKCACERTSERLNK